MNWMYVKIGILTIYFFIYLAIYTRIFFSGNEAYRSLQKIESSKIKLIDN